MLVLCSPIFRISVTLDAHLAVALNRLNEIIKVLTSASIILMTWATISGIYGTSRICRSCNGVAVTPTPW